MVEHAERHFDTGVALGQAEARQLFIDRCWKVGIIGVLYVLLFRDEIWGLINQWRTADGSHGILIPAFSLYFVYQQRDRLRAVRDKASWLNYLGLIIILLCLVGYVYFIYIGMGYPCKILMVGTIFGIVLLVGGWGIIRLVWLPVLYLIFAMPLPGSIHTSLTMPLRELASQISATILGLMPGVYCQASGVIIRGTHLGKEFSLNVADACSGMRLLTTFVALGVAMAYLEHRPIVHRIVLLISTVPIAIFCNIVRVLLTGVIYIYVGPDYAQSTLHTLLGLAMLALAFGLYGLLAWVMNNLFVSQEPDKEDILVVK